MPNHAVWRRASKCDNSGGNCVEVATNLPGAVFLRDSKNPDGPVLAFDRGEFDTFLNGARAGEFD